MVSRGNNPVTNTWRNLDREVLFLVPKRIPFMFRCDLLKLFHHHQKGAPDPQTVREFQLDAKLRRTLAKWSLQLRQIVSSTGFLYRVKITTIDDRKAGFGAAFHHSHRHDLC